VILLLSGRSDPSAKRVAQALAARGRSFALVSPDRYPRDLRTNVRLAEAGLEACTLTQDGEAIDLRSVRAAWYWHPPEPQALDVRPSARRYAMLEAQELFDDLWQLFSWSWVPAEPARVQASQLKISQLPAAIRAGFEIPPTLITSDRTEFLAFYRRHQGRVITKPAGPTAFQASFGRQYSRYTQTISRRELLEASSVAFAPIAIQARVDKRCELRLTIVGERIFAAEIHSQGSRRTRVDWRRHERSRDAIRRHALPESIAKAARSLLAAQGLCYGAIDMVLTPEGRYVFLELNPIGRYGWIERATQLPISEAIAELLIARAEASA
jgi:hypothetical protein